MLNSEQSGAAAARPAPPALRSRRGFSLLELLAASALAAVLMVVLLQVVGSLARSRVVLEGGAAGEEPWRADLVEHLRWDLLNAAEVTAERNRVVLAGHGSLDRATLSPGHLPVTVVYALERLGGRTWLVRRQSPRGGAGREPGWSELVCPDVTAFGVEEVEQAGPIRAGRPAAPFPARRRRRGPLTLDASAASVRVWVDGVNGSIVDRVVILR